MMNDNSIGHSVNETLRLLDAFQRAPSYHDTHPASRTGDEDADANADANTAAMTAESREEPLGEVLAGEASRRDGGGEETVVSDDS